MSVSALVGRVKGAMAAAFPQTVCVVGQISGMKAHSSGHLYFRLKDEAVALDAVMFRASAGRLKFQPTDGLEVVAEGRVDVYEARGQLQLYVERMTPKGQGALELAQRQLVEKLQKEGLFEASHKVAPPRFPRAIGVVSSPTGAAIRDITRTLGRRWPAARVYLAPTLVQGEGAAAQIAEAIRRLDASAARYRIDVILLARGGGSLEDLWAFNEEPVARAIYDCRTPIICGVGHEVDVTVADMVADVRAPTPTGAAELAVPDRIEVRREVLGLAGRLTNAVRDTARAGKAHLEGLLRSAVFRDPAHRVRSAAQRLDETTLRLRAAVAGELHAGRRRLEPAANRLAALHPARLHERAAARLRELMHRLAWVLGARSKRSGDRLAEGSARLRAANPLGRVRLARQKVEAAHRQLESMSYRGVLKRGYSLTRGADGRIVRSTSDIRAGDAMVTEVSDGRIGSRVTGEKEQSSNADAVTPADTARKRAAGPPGRKRTPQTGGPSLFEDR